MEPIRKSRRKTVRNVHAFENEKFDQLQGIWAETMGTPEKYGFWVVYGPEKHGKTTFNLKLAKMLSEHAKVLYISAEEGFSENFKHTMERLNIGPNTKNLLFEDEKLTISEIEGEFVYMKGGKEVSRRNPVEIVIIDNMTVYTDILKKSVVDKVFEKWKKNKLFIFICHEEGKELVGAAAKQAKRLATLLFRVEGLAAHVSGRCPGGEISIDDERAALYHGNSILQTK